MAPRKKTEKPKTSSGACDKDGTRRYVKAPARHGRMAQQRSKTYCTDTLCLSDLTSNKETSESEHGSLRRSQRHTSQTSTRSTQSSDGKENEVSSECRTNSKPQRSTRRKKPGPAASRSSRLADLSSLIDKELSYSEKGVMESEYKLPKHGSVEASCTENEGESPVNLTSTESDSDQLGTAEPFSQGKNSRSTDIEKVDDRRASPGLSSWFQSSQAEDRHRLGIVPGESRNSVKRVPFDEVPFDKKTNTQTQTPVTVRCRDILKSTAHISTPCSEPSTEEEYLFGFENLLNYNEPTLNLSSRLSPISEKDWKRSRRTRKNKHAEILTASQKDCEPWKGLLEYSTSKLYENKPRRRAKTKTLKTRNAGKEDNTGEHNLSELHLFDVTNDELVVRKEEIPVYESEEEEFEKRKKKRPENRKPGPTVRKDELLPWDEIMAHELVIESV